MSEVDPPAPESTATSTPVEPPQELAMPAAWGSSKQGAVAWAPEPAPAAAPSVTMETITVAVPSETI